MAIRTLATIKGWFKKGAYPTETQFSDVWDSFWHKLQTIPQNVIEGLSTSLGLKADQEYVDNSLALKQNKALTQGKIWQGNATGEAVEVDMPTTGGISATPLDVYADLASYVDPTNGQLFIVEDASGDPTVTSGAALYHYRESDTSFRKLAEYESLDILMQALSIVFDPTGTTLVSTNVEAAIKELYNNKLDNALSLGKVWVGGADGKVSEQDFPNMVVVDDLLSTETGQALSANQGRVLKGLIDTINTLLTSDDTTLDELQEVVDYIKLNRSDLDALGISSIAGLQAALDDRLTDSPIDGNQYVRQNGAWVENIDSTVIIDGLLSTETGQALSANQGRVLKGFIDAINTLLTSDDTTLDELQEIVNYIKLNRSDLDTLNVASIIGLQAALDLKLEDAPGDGYSYVRNNGAWVKEGSVVQVESASRTIYVETTGNDETGDGTSVGTAFATAGRAINNIGSLSGGIIITIQFGAGTFILSPSEAFVLCSKRGAGKIMLRGSNDVIYSNVNHSTVDTFVLNINSIDGNSPSLVDGELNNMFIRNNIDDSFYDTNYIYHPIARNVGAALDIGGYYHTATVTSDIINLTTTLQVGASGGLVDSPSSVILNNSTNNVEFRELIVYALDYTLIGGVSGISFKNCKTINGGGFECLFFDQPSSIKIEGCVFNGRERFIQGAVKNSVFVGLAGVYVKNRIILKNALFIGCSNAFMTDTAGSGFYVNFGLAETSIKFINVITCFNVRTPLIFEASAKVNWYFDNTTNFIRTFIGYDDFNVYLDASKVIGYPVKLDYNNNEYLLLNNNRSKVYIRGYNFPDLEQGLSYSLSNDVQNDLTIGDITKNRSIIVDYLIERNSLFEEGNLRILHNGSTLQLLQPLDLKQDNNAGAGIGVVFSVAFDSVNTNLINLQVTLDSGDNATIKYDARRKMI